MSDLQELTKKYLAFRDKREWKQFHSPKNLAISLILEAGEVLEHFQWKTEAETDKYVEKNKEAIGDELADVLYNTLILSHDLGIDIWKAALKKLKKTEKKYPVRKSKGRAGKYTEL